MYQQKNSIFCLLFILALCSVSCKITRNIKKEDTLYTGSTLSVKDKGLSAKEAKVLKNDLQEAIRPKPNSSFLGLRFKLFIYNLGGKSEKEKGLRKFIRNLGEPPVLGSSFDASKNEKILENILYNKGFFYPIVTSETITDTNKRTTKGKFDIVTGPQYTIKDVFFPSDGSAIARHIDSIKGKTLLTPNAPYNLDLIKGERDRISRSLTESGYYYFKSDYLLDVVDTSIGGMKVNMYLTLKEDEMPAEAAYIYKINNVYVYPNYRINSNQADTNGKNAILYEGYYVVDRRKTFKPFVFKQAMQFRPGDIYNRTELNLSLNRLVNLGTFKLVKNRFESVDDASNPLLNVHYYLTPYPKKSVRFELGVESQNDSRLGTQSSISFRNKNTFGGAELLTVSLRGGYEVQSGGADNVKRPPSIEGGAEVSLSFPRFLVPFLKIVPNNMYVPRSIAKVGYDATIRRDLYLIHSFSTSFGYVFKEDIRKEHRLFPVNINYVKTDTLIGRGNPGDINYSNLIFNGLIIGPTYEYTFNSQAAGVRKHNYYFNGQIDFSGNILGLAQGANNPENPNKIIGTPYAQYMKYQIDGRYYLNYAVHQNNMWASRLLFGYGYPYGNSSQLPNIKQFFSGGASSLRGFRSRLVGPGTYNEQYLNPGQQQQFVETLGDIKLEFSSEFRTHIYQFINSAVFIDAGNIWTRNEDPRFPGSKFTSRFYKQLAVDAGAGLRLDFSILILRLDLAVPLRRPWLPEGQEWDWDKNTKPVFNLAIGYPF
ncbi:MAG TPA: BamA/TamA family outer membrane protein [Flavipsychrobacter sp.]|nr:BamA/TamA family outer membrane protein [Flavipsychrobacter sp.]